MKRILIVVLLLISIVICLPSCFDDNTSNTPTIEENVDFASYNSMFEKEFTDYTIEVSIIGANNEVINETYNVSLENGVRIVTYRVERLNQFTIEGDQISIPEGYISVEEGIYTENTERFNVPKFNFSYTCLGTSDVTLPVSYSTNITDLAKFMGSSIKVTDASVKLEFNGSSAQAISISYVTESENTVSIKYIFN